MPEGVVPKGPTLTASPIRRSDAGERPEGWCRRRRVGAYVETPSSEVMRSDSTPPPSAASVTGDRRAREAVFAAAADAIAPLAGLTEAIQRHFASGATAPRGQTWPAAVGDSRGVMWAGDGLQCVVEVRDIRHRSQQRQGITPAPTNRSRGVPARTKTRENPGAPDQSACRDRGIPCSDAVAD